jgi:hypothetical protein
MMVALAKTRFMNPDMGTLTKGRESAVVLSLPVDHLRRADLFHLSVRQVTFLSVIYSAKSDNKRFWKIRAVTE